MVVTELVALTFDQSVDEGDELGLASCQIFEPFKTMSVFIGGFVDDSIPDDKGNLKLKMPIKGSLDDPEFGISHLCQIVMVKAAKSAAYSYLKTMLLPYGALVKIGVDVAVKAGQKMMSLKLAPLVYPPGELQPGPESKTYMDQLVALMTKEPDMRLIICSVATPMDWVAPKGTKISQAEKEKQLLALAKKTRAE